MPSGSCLGGGSRRGRLGSISKRRDAPDNPTPASVSCTRQWPRADFIVGNSPYLGKARQCAAFGDGYVDALRGMDPGVPNSADYVMYWWSRSGSAVAHSGVISAGLITTNSITQCRNRSVITSALAKGVDVMWATPDHSWVEGSDSAAVRVAMTVLSGDVRRARLVGRWHDGSRRTSCPPATELWEPSLMPPSRTA